MPNPSSAIKVAQVEARQKRTEICRRTGKLHVVSLMRIPEADQEDCGGEALMSDDRNQPVSQRKVSKTQTLPADVLRSNASDSFADDDASGSGGLTRIFGKALVAIMAWDASAR
mmetsp:Transcript_107430/g.272597  ORF Transcript_107430/g.272597 Transcript_107430/m.272597 type:complete len:114 (-) Transcript_107430:128-469(-)